MPALALKHQRSTDRLNKTSHDASAGHVRQMQGPAAARPSTFGNVGVVATAYAECSMVGLLLSVRRCGCAYAGPLGRS